MGIGIARIGGLVGRLCSFLALITGISSRARVLSNPRSRHSGKPRAVGLLSLALGGATLVASALLPAGPLTGQARLAAATTVSRQSAPLIAERNLGSILAQSASAHGSSLGTSSDPLTGPANIVIAVDESGSIQPSEMRQEQQAARLIALGEFGNGSKVGVLGFGGADAMESASNPQPPVDQVCPLTEVSTAANRQGLSDCIARLHVRTQAEGWNTDFISAIEQAVSDLVGSQDKGRPALMFLLTDGHLDLYGDPAYSGTQQQVDAAAQANLTSQALPAARRAGVEIWPLGFGTDVDLSELTQIAEGGAQGSCSTLLDAKPRAVTVANAAQAEMELRAIYADARCLGLVPGSSKNVAGGQSVDLTATIPAIATDGAIEVIRQDPQIQVTFFDPAGHRVPFQGSYDGSTFQLGGADSPVESLTITDPLPGTWRVHLQAPAGVASTVVNASVLWQGVLRSDIVVDPPQPKAGARTLVTVRLQLRGEQLVNPAVLAGVTVRAQLTGAGFTTPVSAALADDGVAPDTKAGDGQYTGYLTVPQAATGKLVFTGVVTGQGVVGDERIFSTSLQAGLSVNAQISLAQATIRPGGKAEGTISFSNPTGVSYTIRLLLTDTPDGVTVSPPTIVLAADSGSTTTSFTLHFRSYVPHGPVPGTLEAVNPANPNDVYAQTFIGITVAVPPHWWQLWWAWVLIALVLTTGTALTVVRVNAWRAVRNMEEIELVLYDANDREVDALQAPAGCGRRFAFSIENSKPGQPRLEANVDGAGEYAARRWIGGRSSPGGLVLTGVGGPAQRMSVDSPVASLGDGTSLGFRDLRLISAVEQEDAWAERIDEHGDDPWNGQRSRPRWWRRRSEEPFHQPEAEEQS